MDVEELRKDYYDKFNLSAIGSEKLLRESDELAQLMTKPPTDKQRKKNNDITRKIVGAKNAVHQADLLSLPSDDGYKYALVVIDLATREVQAEPLKDKTANTVRNALNKIYKKEGWKFPERLEVDSGGEFSKIINEHKGDVSVAFAGNHRQVANVESANFALGIAILMRQNAQELLTGEPSREWVKDLPKFVKALNEKWVRDPPEVPKTTAGLGGKEGEVIADETIKGDKVPDDEYFKKIADFEGKELKDLKLFDEGDKVRVKLNEPVAITGEKLAGGKFRSADIRYEVMPVEIYRMIIKPSLPPMYLVKDKNGVRNTAYTKSDLLKVSKEEKPPPPSVIRGKPKTYIPLKIMKERISKGKKEFLIRWKGFDEKYDTWENESVARKLS